MNSNYRNHRGQFLASSDTKQQMHSNRHLKQQYQDASTSNHSHLSAFNNGLPSMNDLPQQHHQSSASVQRVKAPSASDYSMPPMSSVSSIKQLTDQLGQTHLDVASSQYQVSARANYQDMNACSNESPLNQQQQFYNNNNNKTAASANYHTNHPQHYHQQQQQLASARILHNNNINHYLSRQQQQQSTNIDNNNADTIDYANQLRQSQFKHQDYHQNLLSHQQQQQMSSAAASTSNQQTKNIAPNYNNSISYKQDQQAQSQPSYRQLAARNNNNNNDDDNRRQASSEDSGPKSTMHVNFNRCSRVNGNDNSNNGCDDESEGPGRKKKYLTAKYGQQQMNLIKKRLKVEMWLYEQLKELAKGTKSEDELDEIDIDLDELLDMEDDDTRKAWLKKILQPYDDLPMDRVDKFIGDVMEQSRLL